MFAETPNYRALGRAVTGHESFRWHFGPMFYRGRLRDGRVKVLVVGQEGAQDESLAHRSFVGGTGARMQHLLNHLGITRSYLFLNTFCYPIFGQYGDQLRWLAQAPRSPIAAHRNRLFDYVVARNDLQLVIAVGTAAKESVASWFHTHGVDADPAHLSAADPSPISSGLRALGVLHPGGAGSGSVEDIKTDFRRAVGSIEQWRTVEPGWFLPDLDGEPRAADEYEYRSAPLPFRDFPFGTSWRLGRGGTSSNRRDAQRSIQLFSAGGSYNGVEDDPTYWTSATGSPEGYGEKPGDLPYEPPRVSYGEFDSGPGEAMARLLTPAWPGMDGAVAHSSLGFGPIYRGRTDDVTMLILAQAASPDDLFTGRALSGSDGQHFQEWMRSVGIEKRYLILRVPPFGPTGSSHAERQRWVDDPATVAGYRAIIRRVSEYSPHLEVTVTIGRLGSRLAFRLGLSDAVEMSTFGAGGWLASWQRAVHELGDRHYHRDIANPTFSYDGRRGQIPRRDLPFGTLRWQGTSGDRALRARVGGRPSGDYYKLCAPGWVFALPPAPMSSDETEALSHA